MADLKQGLAPDERAALVSYAVFHWPGSNNYCGRPVFAQAVEPNTIGEAIDRTIAFETALTRKQMAEEQPATLAVRRAQRNQQLVDRFEELTLRRNMILGRTGRQAERESELRTIERDLDLVRQERAKLVKPLS